MIIYKVFYKDYELKKGELMAALAERRKGSRGRSELESGIRWAKLMFGQMVKDKNAIFVVPDKLIWKEGSIVPAEKLLSAEGQLRERRINSHYDFFPFSPSKKINSLINKSSYQELQAGREMTLPFLYVSIEINRLSN
jgi:hypothetical protein